MNENDEFKAEYIQLTCSFMELILNENRAHQFIDQSAAVINDEIGQHAERWAFDNPYLQDYEDWFNKIVKYKNFFTERPSYFYDQMEDWIFLAIAGELGYTSNNKSSP